MRFYGWVISDSSNWNILGFMLWEQDLNKFQLGYLYGLDSKLLFMDIKDVKEGKKLIKKLSKIKGFNLIKIIDNIIFNYINTYIERKNKYSPFALDFALSKELMKILDHLLKDNIVYEQRNPHLIYV